MEFLIVIMILTVVFATGFVAYHRGYINAQKVYEPEKMDVKIVVAYGDNKKNNRWGIYVNNLLQLNVQHNSLLPQFIFDIMGQNFEIFDFKGNHLPEEFTNFHRLTQGLEYKADSIVEYVDSWNIDIPNREKE